jgi:CheY-like chemotaxis protein
MAAASGRSAFLLSYVEDEREMYGAALWAAGFLVTVFLDPLLALEQALSSHPDVLVARVLQPGQAIDGIELTRRLRSDRRTERLGVVLITSHIEPAYRDAALGAGCDEFLLLPALPSDVVAASHRAATRRGSMAIHPPPDTLSAARATRVNRRA